jgi:hypothetical protein
VVALLSDDGYNIFTEEHNLGSVEVTGYVSAVCGGSFPIEKDINITMVPDEDLLLSYNKSNYELDEEQYAHLLSDDKYDIENLNINIPSGQRRGLMAITLRPDGLSPDSAYYIPLRADKFSAYEMNPGKSTVLYRVMIKNYYASQKTATYYNLRGVRNGVNTMGIKRLFPIAGNKVRTMAGDISFEEKVDVINKASILLTIDESNHISISSWKDMVVTQVDDDPNYPNIFMIEDDGYKTYKTFLLRYDYVYNGVTYNMQEELRLEFNERNEPVN